MTVWFGFVWIVLESIASGLTFCNTYLRQIGQQSASSMTSSCFLVVAHGLLEYGHSIFLQNVCVWISPQPYTNQHVFLIRYKQAIYNIS